VREGGEGLVVVIGRAVANRERVVEAAKKRG